MKQVISVVLSATLVVTVIKADITSTTVQAGDCVCATTNVNARKTAGLSGTIVILITTGHCGKIVGGTQSVDGYKWYELTYQNQHVWVAGLYLSTAAASSCSTSTSGANRLCHGNVNNLHPTGAASGGVAASERDVAHDLPYLEQHRSCYQQAADANCIQASVIAAVASRESRGGSLLVSTGGYGDGGNAWGIMQCDLRYSGLNCKSCAWDSCCHISMLTKEILVRNVNSVHAKFPSWTMDQALQGGVAAYNFGLSNVQSWSGLDIGSTHNDYSNDVIARAKYLVAHGWN